MFWNNRWTPICGHWFWDNQIGASLFCKKLGYDSGTVSGKGSGQKYSVDSFLIGRCKIGDKIERCTDNANRYEISYLCRRSQAVRINIQCTGGNRVKTASCDGKQKYKNVTL